MHYIRVITPQEWDQHATWDMPETSAGMAASYIYIYIYNYIHIRAMYVYVCIYIYIYIYMHICICNALAYCMVIFVT